MVILISFYRFDHRKYLLMNENNDKVKERRLPISQEDLNEQKANNANTDPENGIITLDKDHPLQQSVHGVSRLQNEGGIRKYIIITYCLI